MPSYYVNDNAHTDTGDHDVHNETCPYLDEIISKTNLGYHESCATAVAIAKETYLTADGCARCSPACHKS